MGSTATGFKAHRCSFQPDRQDPYLRLNNITVFVRDLDRSLRFYVEQLGFEVAFESSIATGDRCLYITPPDGTATLALVAPKPNSEEYKLIGRPTQAVFLTEDVSAKFHEWRDRGVQFHTSPQPGLCGVISADFEDADGNAFTLQSREELTGEIQEQRRAHVERFERERRTAMELETARLAQARLFPQVFPRLETLEYSGTCLQARSVGGDYYDFLDLGRGRLGLVVADVSGKGTAAALLMANLQAHLRNQSTTYWNRGFTPFALEQPARFLLSVNRLFYENTAENAYATMFFAEYDDSTQRLRYANCGHPAAFLVRSDSRVEKLDPTCTVVGLFQDWNCAIEERHLAPGDTLALYTDGVTEAFNGAGEEFGEQRLMEALCRNHTPSPQTLLSKLLDEVRQFSRDKQHDDITLVVARCAGN